MKCVSGNYNSAWCGKSNGKTFNYNDGVEFAGVIKVKFYYKLHNFVYLNFQCAYDNKGDSWELYPK